MLLPKEKNKIVIGLMNDKLCSKIRKELVGVGAKTWRYLTYDNNESKKTKDTKNVS